MQSSMTRCALLLGCLLIRTLASHDAAFAQGEFLPVTVELGDVSLTKLPFVMAAEAGIYRRNGLEVGHYHPNAAELIRRSAGLVFPKEFRRHRHGAISISAAAARRWCA